VAVAALGRVSAFVCAVR